MTENKKFADAKDAAELADLIDLLIEKGSGHINITADESNEISVKTICSTECSGKNNACCQPTEYLDDEDEEDIE